MIVAKLMTENPVTIGPADTLAAALAKMEAGRFRQLPVVEEGKLVGILTDRDVRQQIGQLAHTRVDAVMSANPFSVRPSTPVEKAAHLIATHKIGGLPVLDEGNLVGIITSTDMLRALIAVLGSSKEGTSRIDLALSDPGEIAMATGIVAQVTGQVIGVGTYRGEWNESLVLFLRVASREAHRAAEVLEDQGFHVLAIHS